jgi:drug/metabolite transporter (DMT)-like permease
MAAVSDIMNRLVDLIINPLIRVVFAAAFFYFMYGLVMFLWNSAAGEINDNGKRHMLWGIAGMFIMVTVGGILALILNTFGINQQSATDTSNAGSFSTVNLFGN